MKKLLICISLFTASFAGAQIYKAKSGGTTVSFYSKSPLEDIEAINKGAIVVLNSKTGDLQCAVTIVNFKFKNALMEEHFNENYMETPKFPTSEFKGKINEAIDYKQDGTYDVTVTGKMKIHGKEIDKTYKGKIIIKGNDISVDAKFDVSLKEHDIKVPKLVIKNIAENIETTIHAEYKPYEKKK